MANQEKNEAIIAEDIDDEDDLPKVVLRYIDAREKPKAPAGDGKQPTWASDMGLPTWASRGTRLNAALRVVGANSVEPAMDDLIVHPKPPAPPQVKKRRCQEHAKMGGGTIRKGAGGVHRRGASLFRPVAAAMGEVEPVARFALPHAAALVVSRGSVVDFRGDAIVNAANTGCLGGAGVDGAITKAGGVALAEARLALPEISKGKRCDTGNAVITAGGELRSKWCIHAVGPNYNVLDDYSKGDKLLSGAYAASMRRAAEKGLGTVGFSLLSAGIFRGRRTLEEILSISVQAVRDGAYNGLKEVHLVGFTQEEVDTLITVAKRLFDGA